MMQLNQKILRSIKIIFFLIFVVEILEAQSNRIKVDGVSAVVGDYVILESDIDKTLVEM